MSTPARACLNYGLRDAQNVCALTKVGTVLNSHSASLHSGVQMGTGEFNAGVTQGLHVAYHSRGDYKYSYLLQIATETGDTHVH